MKKNLNNYGFAMVETLVTAVIVITIFTILFNLIYPLMGNYTYTQKYEDIDSKYIAFYIKEMIETDSQPSVTSRYSYDSCGNTCRIFKSNTYKCQTDASGVCLVNGNGEIIYDTANPLDDNFFTVDTHYTIKNDLCDKLDDKKNTKNNKYLCNQFVMGAKITNIYMVNYDTRSFKNNVKNNPNKFTRSFREYVNYLPTHMNASTDKKNNYKLILVEIEHDSYSSYSDVYYSYASIEVKK